MTATLDATRAPATPAESAAGQRPVRLDTLTGLRFIAALLVFGRHIQALVDRSALEPVSGFVLVQGGAGVSFFFVLSGFILTWSRPDGDRPLAFYRRRFARIVPSHSLIWAVALGSAVILTLGDLPSVGQAAASLFLVQSFIPDPDYYFAVNGVAWSLSCEAFFYALFPFLAVAATRIAPERQRLAIAATALAIFAVGVIPTLVDMGPVGLWLVKTCPVTRLLEFLLGILVALEVLRGSRPRIGLGAAVALAGAAYVLAGSAPGTLRWAALTALPFALLIAVAAWSDIDGRRTVLNGTPLVLLGTWSFAFYLTHQIVVEIVIQILPAGDVSVPLLLLLMAGILGMCILVSKLMYDLVERPAERRLRGGRPPV